jgi:hypothetical protein
MFYYGQLNVMFLNIKKNNNQQRVHPIDDYSTPKIPRDFLYIENTGRNTQTVNKCMTAELRTVAEYKITILRT